MQLTKEQVTAGIAAGLALTDPNGDVKVPMKFCAGTLVLRELLLSLGSGNLALVPTVQQNPPPATPPHAPRKPPKKQQRKVKSPPKKPRKKK